jgi:hypothetical protein
MSRPSLLGGVVHKLPADLTAALLAPPKALAAWQDIQEHRRLAHSPALSE